MPHHVAFDIGVWIFQGVTHPRLRGQMYDLRHIREVIGQREYGFAILDIELAKSEAAMPYESIQARLLQNRVVVPQAISCAATSPPHLSRWRPSGTTPRPGPLYGRIQSLSAHLRSTFG